MSSPSIHIHALSYAYERQKVLSDLSLTIVGQGIVGLLGPNGAGKSTLMRLLTGYLSVSEGVIEIYGQSIGSKSGPQIRKLIGYLPERNPLYEEMYVRELLHYSGRLYGLRGATLRRRIEEMIQSCGLEEVHKKKIQSLSKGYKQRVGLARSLLHRPKLLILDEASAGLDPNQMAEFRQLLRNLSSEMCILFSTHILQEIEELCDEVLLLNRGRLLVQSSLDGFKARYQHQEILRIAFEEVPGAEIKTSMEQLEGLHHLESLSDQSFLLYPEGSADLRASLLQYCAAQQLPIRSIEAEKPTLEHIFKQLTQAPSK